LKQLRVLVVGAFPPTDSGIFGGIVTTCRTLLSSSFPDRFDLALFDTTQISNPPPPLIRRMLLAASRFGKYLKLVLERPDAVLIFTSGGASLVEKTVMARVAGWFGCAVLLFPRSGIIMDQFHASFVYRKWIGMALSSADTLLCQGPAWHRFAVDGLGFKPECAPIIPNWTASDALLAIGRSRRTRPSGLPVRLLFLGWLEDHKGVFELLEACRELLPSHSFQLTLAGRGDAETRAKEFVEREGLGGVVAFAGWVRGDELLALFSESDVLVLPSWHEGFPNAMIEAMAAGLAVVVSAVGNVPDVVTNGEEALLVPPKDAAALAAALGRVMDDGELRNALAMRGLAFAAGSYGVEQGVARLTKAINEAVLVKQVS